MKTSFSRGELVTAFLVVVRNSLRFVGSNFNATVNTPFKLGTITYFNGTNNNGTTSIDLKISVNLTNVPEKNFVLSAPLALINTDNTNDPVASVQSLQRHTGFECTEVIPTSPSDRGVVHPVSSPIGVMIRSLLARAGRLP